MTANRPMVSRFPVVLLLVILLAGCGEDRADFNLTDATGKVPDLKLGITDTHGEVRTAEDFRGRAVLLYFGYTHCPDACPMSLGRIKAALRQLPADKAERTTVVFVTVDPDRDTPERLRSYLANFHLPRGVGLLGRGEDFDRLKERYHIHVERQREGPDDTDYEVTHPSQVYVFGPDGRARLLARLSGGEPDSPEALAADLEKLL
ncbi:SCO family protein [Thiohalorhabdus sp.]|uniref:SCO family protein n=1 Tax=Thiohalorhabdus sp. TaxID=3094134 RepID=UPI002FC3785E